MCLSRPGVTRRNDIPFQNIDEGKRFWNENGNATKRNDIEWRNAGGALSVNAENTPSLKIICYFSNPI